MTRRLFVIALAVAPLIAQQSPVIDASRYPTLQQAVDAAPDQGIVQMAAGVYVGPATIRRNVSLIGSGVERTFVVTQAGSDQPALRYAPRSTASSVEISGFTINLSDARQATALELNNLGGPVIHHVRVEQGAIGLLVNSTGSGHFSDLTFHDQDVAAIRVNGDDGAENHWTDISIVRERPGILLAGWELLRTNDHDLGGQYLSRVRVNELVSGGAKIVNGFRIVSTVPNTQVYLSFNQCVADAMSGGDSWLFRNVSDVRIVNSWGANNASADAGFSGISIDRSAIFQVSSSDFRSRSQDVSILGDANLLSFVNNRFAGGRVNVHPDRAGVKTALMFVANRYNALPTDDPEQLAGAATLDPLSAAGLTVWTRDDMGTAQTLRLVNQSNGGVLRSKNLRVNHRGQFEILNDAGKASIFTADDDGNVFVEHLTVDGVNIEAKLEELRQRVLWLEQAQRDK